MLWPWGRGGPAVSGVTADLVRSPWMRDTGERETVYRLLEVAMSFLKEGRGQWSRTAGTVGSLERSLLRGLWGCRCDTEV